MIRKTQRLTRVMLIHTKQHLSLMPIAVDMAMYTDLRMATDPSRGWLTPYEIIKGTQPSIKHMRPFDTLAQVTVPKAKRAALKSKGLPLLRAEAGRLIGYQDPYSTVYKVMLPGWQSHRAQHQCHF